MPTSITTMASNRFIWVGTIGAFAITSIILYLRHLHKSLHSQITNVKVKDFERKAAHASQDLECLPKDLIEHPEDFRIIHERDEKDVQMAIPGNEVEKQELFTHLLRHNMSLFSRFPQCWILRLMVSPDKAHTFSRKHLESLEFREGDVYCGLQVVLKRSALKAEIGSLPHPKFGDMNGRLVLSLQQDNGRVFLRPDTIPWTKASNSTKLPLESGFAKYLHDFASWGLLVAGANFLEKSYPV